VTYLGVDPGHSGAAVSLADDGLTVLAAWRWTPRVLETQDGRVLAYSAPHQIAAVIGPHAVAAVEAPYVGLSHRGSLSLAEWTGGFLSGLDVGEILRPTAAEWRAKVLHVGRVRRAPAKALALRAAALHARGLPWLDDHVAEAWCLARFAWGWARRGGA